jgi:hypothetical protein
MGRQAPTVVVVAVVPATELLQLVEVVVVVVLIYLGKAPTVPAAPALTSLVPLILGEAGPVGAMVVVAAASRQALYQIAWALVGCMVVAAAALEKEQVFPMPLLPILHTVATVLLELYGLELVQERLQEHFHQPIQVTYK